MYPIWMPLYDQLKFMGSGQGIFEPLRQLACSLIFSRILGMCSWSLPVDVSVRLWVLQHVRETDPQRISRCHCDLLCKPAFQIQK